MNIAPWTDTPFDDDDAQQDFQFVLGLSLDKIAEVMYASGYTYATYPLYDAQPENRDWLLDLQTELQSIYTLLGLNGLPDFASVDLKKEDEHSDWHFLLTQTIQTINANLGIT